MTARQVLVAVVVAVASICLLACGPAVPSRAGGLLGTDPTDVRYSCGGPPGFLPELLEGPAVAELEDHPSAAALRASIAEVGLDIDMLPASGYWLVHRDGGTAQYLAREPITQALIHVSFKAEAGAWMISGWGGCEPRIELDGLSQTVWAFDPDEPIPGPADTAFTALVTEMQCTGGQAMGDRLLPPSIAYDDDVILVVFAARPLDLGMATCPSNPVSRVVVELHEPLGDRVLRDAGTFPPRDPAAPAF